jgi:hypothetical protein
MVGCPKGRWISRRGYRDSVRDMAFCNGELYGLMHYRKELTKFEIAIHEDGTPFFKAVHRLPIQFPHDVIFPEDCGTYIVELCGKIVMAVRMIRGQRPCSRNIRGPFFTVFELSDTSGEEATTVPSYKWVEMTSLGDHALFLGPTCSKAIHVLTDGFVCARRNHIYYSHHRCFTRKQEMPHSAKEFLRSSNSNSCHRVYYKEDESIDNGMEGIMSVGYYVRGGVHPPMWIFPPNI